MRLFILNYMLIQNFLHFQIKVSLKMADDRWAFVTIANEHMETACQMFSNRLRSPAILSRMEIRNQILPELSYFCNQQKTISNNDPAIPNQGLQTFIPRFLAVFSKYFHFSLQSQVCVSQNTTQMSSLSARRLGTSSSALWALQASLCKVNFYNFLALLRMTLDHSSVSAVLWRMFSTAWGYHQFCGGFSVLRGCSLLWQSIISTVVGTHSTVADV